MKRSAVEARRIGADSWSAISEPRHAGRQEAIMARARDAMVLRRPRQSKAHRFVIPSVWLMTVLRRPPVLDWNEYVLQTIGAESKAKRWSRDDNHLTQQSVSKTTFLLYLPAGCVITAV
jgi:hypothetical protein